MQLPQYFNVEMVIKLETQVCTRLLIWTEGSKNYRISCEKLFCVLNVRAHVVSGEDAMHTWLRDTSYHDSLSKTFTAARTVAGSAQDDKIEQEIKPENKINHRSSKSASNF